MTAENSPMYALGQQAGVMDALLIAMCPPQAPVGAMPPNPDYPVMYLRGYHSTFDGAIPHECTEKCRKDGQR